MKQASSNAKRVWYRSDDICSVPSLRDLSYVSNNRCNTKLSTMLQVVSSALYI